MTGNYFFHINGCHNNISSISQLSSRGLFLDFSKAFNVVGHNIMLQKLKYFGVDERGLNMFEIYLKNRKQYVEVNQSKSDMTTVECGVPQGN